LQHDDDDDDDANHRIPLPPLLFHEMLSIQWSLCCCNYHDLHYHHHHLSLSMNQDQQVKYREILSGRFDCDENDPISSYNNTCMTVPVKKQRIFFPDLPEEFDGFTITQISDVHSGSFDNPEKINYAIDLINEQESDMILFTGDIVNTHAKEMLPWIETFNRIKKYVFHYYKRHLKNSLHC
jgi:hypothetical protein